MAFHRLSQPPLPATPSPYVSPRHYQWQKDSLNRKNQVPHIVRQRVTTYFL